MNPIRRRLADACYWLADRFADLGDWIAGHVRKAAEKLEGERKSLSSDATHRSEDRSGHG